jgi:hypothetical protein
MGVDVASFGDYFADKRLGGKLRPTAVPPAPKLFASQLTAGPAVEVSIENRPLIPKESTTQSSPPKHVLHGWKQDDPIKCLVYKDPFSATYKKYIFSADGKHLLGGMMVGDVGDYVKLVDVVRKKVRTPVVCAEFGLSSAFRNPLRFRLLSSSLARRRMAQKAVTIWTMIPKFAVVTLVALCCTFFLHRAHQEFRTSPNLISSIA